MSDCAMDGKSCPLGNRFLHGQHLGEIKTALLQCAWRGELFYED